VTDGFREILRKAKIETGSFHSLRHTAATQMLELEVPPKIVQERLGHSTIAITMDLYSHSTPSMQAEAARRLDVMLGPLLMEEQA
jgi:integrase